MVNTYKPNKLPDAIVYLLKRSSPTFVASLQCFIVIEYNIGVYLILVSSRFFMTIEPDL